jgi:YD repeat-containing protein
LGYAYDAYSRLSSITAYDNANYLSFTAGVSRSASQASTSVYSNQGQLMGFSQTFGRDTFGRVSSTTDYLGSTALRWDRDRLAARGRTSTADRWEYRYNARGEVASAWKQSGASVTTPASGEIQAATGTLYAYEDIGNRSTVQEASRAALSTTTSPTSIDTASANTTLKPTGYTVNALNQYTGVSHPVDDNGKMQITR